MILIHDVLAISWDVTEFFAIVGTFVLLYSGLEGVMMIKDWLFPRK